MLGVNKEVNKQIELQFPQPLARDVVAGCPRNLHLYIKGLRFKHSSRFKCSLLLWHNSAVNLTLP